MAKYRLSFIEMSQVLLNAIFETQSGNWELLLEYLKDLVPYAFAHGNVHERYLKTMIDLTLQRIIAHLWMEIFQCSFQIETFSVTSNLTNLLN